MAIYQGGLFDRGQSVRRTTDCRCRIAVHSTGSWLDGGRTYRVRVPANVPVVEFWSITVYDNMTRSMIQSPSNQPAVSSLGDLVVNDDDSIDVDFGPDASATPSNWVQTVPDKGWFA